MSHFRPPWTPPTRRHAAAAVSPSQIGSGAQVSPSDPFGVEIAFSGPFSHYAPSRDRSESMKRSLSYFQVFEPRGSPPTRRRDAAGPNRVWYRVPREWLVAHFGFCSRFSGV